MAGVMFEEKSTRISISIKDNDLEGLCKALKDGEDPFHTDRKGNTYIHYACTMQRSCIFHSLVSAGININAQNRHGNTALHVTALQSDCSHVGDLLAAGIDPTIKNKSGKTASEIDTKNKLWKTFYDKYQPGIFQAVEEHNVKEVLFLLHCWSRIDTKRCGQTLRQFAASRKFHDIVFHIDKHQHTLSGIYAVLEGNLEKASQFLCHTKCDVNLLNYASETSHILQHAIRLKNAQFIRLICKAKLNPNIRVSLNCYLKAPLFFAAFDPSLTEDLMWTILKTGVDFQLRDERGRNAAIYALDKTNRKISSDVIAFMLANGLDVSQRDVTGVTLRDVARFARRKDILSLIDKAYIKTIRSSDVKELKRFCMMGYDSMFINFNYRDTFIFASGNETDEALDFITQVPFIRAQIRLLHPGIRHWSKDKTYKFLTDSQWQDILLSAKDKGGRSAFHLAVLFWRMDLLEMFCSLSGCNAADNVDNAGRSPYHYACCVEEETERDEFCHILENAGINQALPDFENRLAKDLVGRAESSHWIQQERKTRYGMEKQIQCVDKYEELCRMMKFKGKTLQHFERSVCRFPYPVALFHKILSPLMPEYRDLIFVAMDAKKEDIVVRLIQLGTDWTLTDRVNSSGDPPKKKQHSLMDEKVKAEEGKMQGNLSNENSDPEVEDWLNELFVSWEKENNSPKLPGLSTVKCQETPEEESVGQDAQFEEEIFENVTVEERACHMGMHRVTVAVNKKVAHLREKKRDAQRQLHNKSANSEPKVRSYVLSPIRSLGSRTSDDDHDIDNKEYVTGNSEMKNDVVFSVENIDCDSVSDEEEKGENDNGDEDSEGGYSDDEFYSDNDAASDEYNYDEWD